MQTFEKKQADSTGINDATVRILQDLIQVH